MSHPSILDQPLVSFGRGVCGDFEAATRREWLVTNGLGGFACGTLAGLNTRRYHGLLVAALAPPAERTVLVAGLVEWAAYDGRRYPLYTHEFGDGTLDGNGYHFLQEFQLEGMLPVWTFAVGDALLERRVWMAQGANTSYVRYQVLRGTAALALEVTPLVTYRDFHTLSSGQGWRLGVEVQPRAAVVTAYAGARPYRLEVDAGSFAADGDWWWDFRYRAEAARGLDDHGDLYAPGSFRLSLAPGAVATLTLTAEEGAAPASNAALGAVQARQHDQLERANAAAAHPVVQQLTLAADQFIVARDTPQARDASAKTVIAGYPWFGDWGRDTMIALPGLTLATGRPRDAKDILRAFARYMRDGLLPNNFPDRPGADPGYNTVDAALWYVLAARAYEQTTGDRSLVDELLPALRQIIDCYQRGTRYGIGVDPADGLLRAGEPGVQLTWMDAKVGDWVITPRIGKPVEVNALWYNALRSLAELLWARTDTAAQEPTAQAERVRVSFLRRFRQPDRPYLADVVDGPQGDDWRLRPNQVFALSLPFPLLEGAAARPILEAVGRTLLADCGLRSLSPDDPAYQGDYGGAQRSRDGAYHQGTAWTWLLAAYVEAHHRTYGDAAAALALLRPIEHHLHDAGLGTISELLDGDAPHHPRGSIAQAWSVGETLRVWRMLEANSGA